MKVEFTLCFIIHSRPYLESSLLLDVFSKQYGRLDILAKGIRRRKSPFSGRLQPYQRLLMSWVGRSELMTLTDVEIDCDTYQISGEKIILGFYINELISRLLHRHDPHPELFTLYEQTISGFSSTQNSHVILRIFEKGLLESLGYGLSLKHDINDGQLIEASKRYYYTCDKGPTKYMPATNDYVKISGNSLLSLLNCTLTENVELEEVKHLMRFILQKYLGDKPLSSKALYKSYINSLDV